MDPRVLGQLLAAQNVLSVLPAETIGSFLAEALAIVPGVASVVVCLAGTPAPAGGDAEACAACPIRDAADEPSRGPVRTACALGADPTTTTVRIGSTDEVFGFIVLRCDVTGRCTGYLPFLVNLAAHISLTLENRGQERLLEEARVDLERRVAARTRDLLAANEALEREVAERRRAEDALRASEERYRRITETVTDYIYRVVARRPGRGTIASHGPGCLAVTGYTAEELDTDRSLIGRILSPQARALVDEHVDAALAGERRAPLEHQLTRKDGVVRWVRHSMVPILDADGRPGAYDGLVADITEERLLRDQLIHAQKMESVGRLAGGVAHDFNNLLTAILGNVSLACADLPDAVPEDHPLRSDLDEIRKAGERATTLTRQLLAFGSRQTVEPRRLDLGVAVADSLSMLRRLLGEDIDIVTTLRPGLGAIEADPGQVQQLLVNLAVNARDAMPGGGRLAIETDGAVLDGSPDGGHPDLPAGRYVRLTVADTGVGMTPEVQAHLFEPFFTTKERGKGTGLGLSICHGIVRQAGGEITVDSERGRGTTFRVLLPQVDGPADAVAAPADERVPRGTETVLVVEDEPAVRLIAVRGLRAQGYRVHEAASGEAALVLLAGMDAPPAVLLTDVVMPGISGPQLAARVLASHPHTRVLLVSGHAERDALPMDVRETGLPFLPKPYTPERIARRLREVLDAPENAAGNAAG